METYQDVFVTFMMGLGAILALVLTFAFSSVMLAWSAKARRTLATIDSNPALVAFGQSATGQYLHNQLQSLLPQVDQSTDKAIQDLLKVPLLKSLYNQGIIDAPTLSKGLSHVLGLTIDLLDGKPSGGVSSGLSHLMEKDSPTSAPLAARFQAGQDGAITQNNRFWTEEQRRLPKEDPAPSLPEENDTAG